ncbi:MAG: N-6 DNA methylase [Leptolyngbyaceae cyanobacterium CSU_1_4]|nr:N-6 DNA methylase [Leptolyngbyaceae cyanobacterium CSU_1_4]
MVKPTSLKWVTAWYEAIAADLMTQEPRLTPVELGQRVQNCILDKILDKLYGEVYAKHGVGLPEFAAPASPICSIEPPPIPSITAQGLGEIYEQILSQNPAEKKTGGIYYTPSPLIDFVVENTVRILEKTLPTILDPACGSGFFC